MAGTFPDPWLAAGPSHRPQQTWYGVSRAMPHAATLGRLMVLHPSHCRQVHGVGTFLGPVTMVDHPVTWQHHGLGSAAGHGHQYWWCVSQDRGGFGVGTRLWSHARVLEIVAGFQTPRSRTALVRVHGAPT